MTAWDPGTYALYGCRGGYPAGRRADTDRLAARALAPYKIVNGTEKYVNIWLNPMKILICCRLKYAVHNYPHGQQSAGSRAHELNVQAITEAIHLGYVRGIGQSVEDCSCNVNEEDEIPVRFWCGIERISIAIEGYRSC